jgi:hypothetical protein
VSPLSGYAECNPNKWGGTSLQKAMAVTVRRGLLPDKIQPAEYGFKHQLQGTTGRGGINQSSGDWIALRDFPDGWQDTAKHFKIEELILPEDAEQVISLVLNGLAVAVARNGHAIPYTHYDHEQQLMGYVDSYDVIRWDTMRTVKSAIGGAYAITAVTTPDDWNKPAG